MLLQKLGAQTRSHITATNKMLIYFANINNYIQEHTYHGAQMSNTKTCKELIILRNVYKETVITFKWTCISTALFKSQHLSHSHSHSYTDGRGPSCSSEAIWGSVFCSRMLRHASGGTGDSNQQLPECLLSYSCPHLAPIKSMKSVCISFIFPCIHYLYVFIGSLFSFIVFNVYLIISVFSFLFLSLRELRSIC